MSEKQQPLLVNSPSASNDKCCKGKSGLHHCLMATFAFLVLGMLIALLFITGFNSKQLHKNHDVLEKLIEQSPPPYKFTVDHMTPRKFQHSRGTCWDFGTVSTVEHAYRLHGIEKGWLDVNQYMSFSEQAYGNMILRLCQESEDNKKVCQTPGDNVAFNSTEGGEAHLLYMFKDTFENGGMLPHSICPYIPDKDDSSCPNLDKDVKGVVKKNPVRFDITEFDTLYDRETIKGSLWTNKKALAWSSPIHGMNYYIACDEEITKKNPEKCSPEKCVKCPLDTPFPTSCCLELPAPMYNMDGEFRYRHELVLEAGHCMTGVGYNDRILTKEGYKGGFILRNTWEDGNQVFDEFHEVKPRGSHSLAYWMQWISESDEKYLCPNVHNPRNWVLCGDMTQPGQASADICSNAKVQDTAVLARTPAAFECRDETLGCSKNYLYYMVERQVEGDELFRATFIAVDPATKAYNNNVTFVNTPLAHLSLVFVPIKEHSWPNSDDYCGYYIMPYEVQELTGTLFGGYYANYYGFKFDKCAYEANKDSSDCSKYDYQYVKNSTLTQKLVPTFTTQYPDPLTSDGGDPSSSSSGSSGSDSSSESGSH